MQHMRAPPTFWHVHAIKTNSTVTMRGQHTRHGVLPSLFSLNLKVRSTNMIPNTTIIFKQYGVRRNCDEQSVRLRHLLSACKEVGR